MGDKDKRMSGYPTDVSSSQKAFQQKYEDNMKLFENYLHIPDFPESEEQAKRARANTMPSSMPSIIYKHIAAGDLHTHLNSYSCDLSDFSRRSDFLRTANSKRVQTWINPYQDEEGSATTASMKNEQDMEIEEESTSQSTSSGVITPLNWSMKCNEGSPITTPIRRELDIEMVQVSTISPAALDIEHIEHIEHGTEEVPMNQDIKDKIFLPKFLLIMKAFYRWFYDFLILYTLVVFILVFFFDDEHSSDCARTIVKLKKLIYFQDQA